MQISALTKDDTDDLTWVETYLAGQPTDAQVIQIYPPRIKLSTYLKYIGYKFSVTAENYIKTKSPPVSQIIERVDTNSPVVNILGGKLKDNNNNIELFIYNCYKLQY